MLPLCYEALYKHAIFETKLGLAFVTGVPATGAAMTTSLELTR